ncbi:MAG: UDP-2,3-diacylglucosamine diphosphatase [Bacteroidales bacterium]|nr:UDP-2,3-diacylglucosamine diphosphatase [Bacteroidales bacterium]
MENRYKIYFASDFHLGLATETPSIDREKKIVNWLVSAAADAKEIYLLGDIFDFWWEYRNVVPKGFTRFLGAVASITDSGIPVHFFTGNHDLWANDYLSEECGMIMHRSPVTVTHNGKTFHLAHGDGLGTKNAGRRLLSAMFRNRVLQKMYSALHPSIGVWAGRRWSQYSAVGKGTETFCGEENEDLVRYARTILLKENIDYFIFGHRHFAINHALNPGCEILFLGSWKSSCNYGLWDGRQLCFVKTPGPG